MKYSNLHTYHQHCVWQKYIEGFFKIPKTFYNAIILVAVIHMWWSSGCVVFLLTLRGDAFSHLWGRRNYSLKKDNRVESTLLTGRTTTTTNKCISAAGLLYRKVPALCLYSAFSVGWLPRFLNCVLYWGRNKTVLNSETWFLGISMFSLSFTC